MMNQAILRELGAIPRRFRSVHQALCWFGDQRSARTGRAMLLEAGGVPRSQEKIDETNATYARIAACLKQRHEADPEEEIELFPRRIAALLAWYTARAPWVADEHGMGRVAFDRYCGYTENVVRRRMEAAGLFHVEPVEAAA